MVQRYIEEMNTNVHTLIFVPVGRYMKFFRHAILKKCNRTLIIWEIWPQVSVADLKIIIYSECFSTAVELIN